MKQILMGIRKKYSLGIFIKFKIRSIAKRQTISNPIEKMPIPTKETKKECFHFI